jgi:tRNA threonylcarbamoyladenosine biosynthesis protein TsaB
MWLALETATDRASVAIGETADDAVEESLTGARRHAGALLPMVQAVLRRRGAALEQVAGVVVSDGPGSFTGLRVGASAAKALVRARRVPLRAAPSLMARALAGAGPGQGRVLAVSDALRGEVYAGAFRFLAGQVVTELEPGVWRPDSLAELDLAPDALVGEVPPAARSVLERWSGLEMVGPPGGSPRATGLIALVTMAGGARLVPEAAAWEPVYGRPAEAQARWEITHGRPLPDSVGGSR